MLSRFDVILLDEPTNDLDLDGLARLEALVGDLRGGVVLVSHDREFLARSVTRVLELDLAQNTTTVFGGGYESYLEEREIGRGTAANSTRSSPRRRPTWWPAPACSGNGPARGAQRDPQGTGQRQDPPPCGHRVQ
jgi:ATPase subunit of ABC transporter with duplicated ATPase domains